MKKKRDINVFIVGLVALVAIGIMLLSVSDLSTVGQVHSAPIQCTDTDGGAMYTEQGTMTITSSITGFGNAPKTDVCEDNDYLREYLCPTRGQAAYTIVSCEDVVGAGAYCSDGACVPTAVPESVTEISDVTYETNGDVTTVSLSYPEDVITVVSSPTLVNGLVMWMPNGADTYMGRDTISDELMVYNPTDGILYNGGTFKSSEGTITYVPEKDWIIIPVLGGSPQYYVLDAATLESAASSATRISAVVDSSLLYLDDVLYMGTYNTPKPTCDGNDDCGTMYAIDAASGTTLAYTDASVVQTWWIGSPTTNGEFILGGGSEENDDRNPGGCTSYKLNPVDTDDSDLTILDSIDPDAEECYRNGAEGTPTEDAVAGELVFGADDAIWLLRTRPGDSDKKVTLMKLNSDLEEQCRAEWDDDTDGVSAAHYYEGPTVDKDGNVYTILTLPYSGIVMQVHLYKITPSCVVTEIAYADPGAKSYATATIAQDSAGDEYVLFAVEDSLQIYRTDGTLYKEVTLGDDTYINTAPLVVDGMIDIVHSNGALDVVSNSGLTGLSQEAYWPTFRHDQWRTGDSRTEIQ